MTLLEAMSFYCPVIAPNIGGPLELVDKNSGFNIDVKNHDEIIEKIKYLSSDYSIWQRYALSARKRSLHFNKNKFNESISLFFDQRII